MASDGRAWLLKRAPKCLGKLLVIPVSKLEEHTGQYRLHMNGEEESTNQSNQRTDQTEPVAMRNQRSTTQSSL